MTRYIISFAFCISTIASLTAQTDITSVGDRLVGESDRKLQIGGYAQIDYNQPLDRDYRQAGKLDVHRLVLAFGYNFNDRISFFSEIELEHVKEIYVEQAYLNYRIKDWLQVRGGLLLVPMGIMNEYHEPPTFSGVERPYIDTYISPTTWREIGAGFSGKFKEISLKYQLYIINGFSSYDDGPTLSAAEGFRKGRQKGAESFVINPNISGRIDYYGVLGLNLGLSAYAGKTQSALYKKLPKDDDSLVMQADSSVVGLSMIGADARYVRKGIHARAQYYLSWISNAGQYNDLTDKDLGSSMFGYYLELGYNVFQPVNKISSELIPFVRYEEYDTQHSMADGMDNDPSNHRMIWTIGLGWKIIPGVAVKCDYQLIKDKADAKARMFNAGIGVWF